MAGSIAAAMSISPLGSTWLRVCACAGVLRVFTSRLVPSAIHSVLTETMFRRLLGHRCIPVQALHYLPKPRRAVAIN